MGLNELVVRDLKFARVLLERQCHPQTLSHFFRALRPLCTLPNKSGSHDTTQKSGGNQTPGGPCWSRKSNLRVIVKMSPFRSYYSDVSHLLKCHMHPQSITCRRM